MTLALSNVQKTLNIIFGIINRSQSIPFLKGLFCWDPLYSHRIRGGGRGRVLSFSFRPVTLGIHFEPLILFEEIGRKKKTTTTKAWFQHSKYFFKERLDYLLWNYSLKEVLLCNSYVRRDYAKFCAQAHHLKNLYRERTWGTERSKNYSRPLDQWMMRLGFRKRLIRLQTKLFFWHEPGVSFVGLSLSLPPVNK